MQWKPMENILKTVAKLLGFKTFEQLVHNASMTVSKRFPNKQKKTFPSSKLVIYWAAATNFRGRHAGCTRDHSWNDHLFFIYFYPSLISSNYMMTSSNGKKTFSALLAFCAENSLVTGIFPVQRPVTRSFDVLFDLRLNKRLSKQSWGWWFETLSRPSWRNCNVSC